MNPITSPKLPSREELKHSIQLHYATSSLTKIVKHYLLPIFRQHSSLCEEKGIPVALMTKSQKPTAEMMRETLAEFFLQPSLFKLLYNQLDDVIKPIFYKLVWSQGLFSETIKKTTTVEAVVFAEYKIEVQEPFSIFAYQDVQEHYMYSFYNLKQNSQKQVFFFLPKAIRDCLRPNLPAPEAIVRLHPVEEEQVKAQSTVLYLDPIEIFTELPLAIVYQQEDRLKITTRGFVTGAAFPKFRKFLNIREFFEEKELQNLRSRILAEIVNALGKYARVKNNAQLLRIDPPLEMIKLAFTLLRENIISPAVFLPHIKNWYQLGSYYQPEIFKHLFQVLEALPLGQWISFSNLLAYFDCWFDPVFLVSFKKAVGYLELVRPGFGGRYKNHFEGEGYYKYLHWPFVQGVLAAYATLGALEIAWNKPPDEATSGYAGLAFVRLTPLGAYLSGQARDYSPPEIQKEEIQLDEKRLFITYTGQNKSLRAMLANVSRPISTNLYKVDFESVLGNANSGPEVARQIKIFEQLLDKNPPALWKTFFAELQRKSYRLENLNETYRIYQLPENQELLQLFARDEYLKTIAIRAEGFKVLIPITQLPKVKKYLKKSGFLIEME
ncbi:MAG: hypothetical protein OHK0053_23070 [Microscillaceae bacterium]